MVGIIGAAVVTMGIIALPAMLKRDYDPKIAMGAIMAGGTKTTRAIVDQPASTAPVQPDQPQLPRVPLN